MTPLRWIVAVLGLLVIGAGLVGLHHYLARPDRVRADALYREMCSVRDQILLYEYQTGTLPEKLSQLVPHQLRGDQIETAAGPRFRYSPEKRWIEEVKGPAISGVITRHMEPRGIDLPQPDRQTAIVTPEPIRRPEPQPVKIEPIASTASAKPVTASHAAVTDVKPTDSQQPAVTQIVAPTPESPASRQAVAEPTPPATSTTLLNDRLILPKGPALEDPPAGAYVFEAEHFTQTNYGWEVMLDPEAAGGAFLHCKEGIANGPAQARIGVGNFYQTRSNSDLTMLRFHLSIPVSGNYYVYGRMFTTDTHCSNYVCAAFDKGGPYIGGMGNTTPFRWLWSPVKNENSEGPHNLSKGDHFLHLFIHEDGVRVDQFILSPVPITGATRYKANFLPGKDTTFAAEKGPPVHTHLSYPTMVLSPDWKAAASVAIRRIRPIENGARARLKAMLLGAAPQGKDLVLTEGELDVGALPDLSFLPLSFESLDVKKLARREYMLKVELTQPDGMAVSCETPMMKPFSYQVFGPGKFVPNDTAGPLDADADVPAGETRKWQAFAEKSWQIFGVLDFGLQTTGNSLHPMQQTSIYGRTKIYVPKSGTYLFKIQADDQMILWLDGQEVFRHNETHPVTRTACRVKLKLEAGEHRLRFRVNQLEGRWQAMLRIRTEDDNLSDVIGVE